MEIVLHSSLGNKINRRKMVAVITVSVISAVAIAATFFANSWLLENYTPGYFIRKNAEKVMFRDKESFLEYIQTEKPMDEGTVDGDLDEFFNRTDSGKMGVVNLHDHGLTATDGFPETTSQIYLEGEKISFSWRNGEAYEIIQSGTYPIEVITYKAYRESYEQNSHIKKIINNLKYIVCVIGIPSIVFVQIAISRKIAGVKHHKKAIKKADI